MRSLILSIFIFFSLSQSLLASSTTQVTREFIGEIKAFDVGSFNNMVRVYFDNTNLPNPDSCGEATYYVIEPNENTGPIFKLLLSAAISKRKVRLYINSCSETFNGKTRPKIRYARLI